MVLSRANKKVMWASMCGGILEFYDFTVYGFLTPAIAPLIFPKHDPLCQLLFGYGIFAVGFLCRPLGSIVFGHIGDRLGRQKALFLSMMLMAFSTLGMGILPTYESLGIGSAIIMTLFRMVQGISAGGEYSGSIIFAVEHSPVNKRGLVGSVVVAGCMSGVFFGSFISHKALAWSAEWGWRLPFIIGFLVSIVGIYIRYRVPETPVYTAMAVKARRPLWEGLRSQPFMVLGSIGIAGFVGINLYVVSIFLPSYLTIYTGTSGVKLASSLATACMALGIPIFGHISDKVGRAPLMRKGALTLIACVSLCIFMFLTKNILWIYLGYILFAIVACMFMGPMNTFIVEMFAAKERYSCAAFSYSIGMAFFGGFSPMVAAYLGAQGGLYAVGIYLMLGAYIGYLGVQLSQRSTPGT